MPAATLKLFLPFGDPKRLRIVELSNWTGKAVAGPRSDFEGIIKRDESSGTGVYFLTGIDPETDSPAIYIGEAECIRDRIKSHTSTEFWNNIVFFVSKDENLTKAHVKYLEGRLIDLGRELNRFVVVNSQSSGARLPESDREDMEIFLEKMQQVLPVLNVEAFVKPISAQQRDDHEDLLFCRIKDVTARGYLTPNGLTVLTDSEAVLDERESAQNYPSVLKRRKQLIEDGHIIESDGKLRFTRDVEFSSSSAAAAVVHGGSANGLISWKDDQGRTLKQREDA